MKTIGENEELLKNLDERLSLISSVVKRIQITAIDMIPIIEVEFDLMYPKEKTLIIKFEGIKKYYLNYESVTDFYNVEILKFFSSSEGFYLSLDPYDEILEINEKDNDVILCSHIEGFML